MRTFYYDKAKGTCTSGTDDGKQMEHYFISYIRYIDN